MLKEGAFDELFYAIRTISSGKTYLSPKLAKVVVDDYVRKLSDEDTSSISALTAREREVLQLLSEGNSTKEISRILDVSVKTIESYRSHLMAKLDVQSIAELTKIAIREGLTTLD
jgi:DNA-binding NarL/FixJ family response regulator